MKYFGFITQLILFTFFLHIVNSARNGLLPYSSISTAKREFTSLFYGSYDKTELQLIETLKNRLNEKENCKFEQLIKVDDLESIKNVHCDMIVMSSITGDNEEIFKNIQRLIDLYSESGVSLTIVIPIPSNENQRLDIISQMANNANLANVKSINLIKVKAIRSMSDIDNVMKTLNENNQPIKQSKFITIPKRAKKTPNNQLSNEELKSILVGKDLLHSFLDGLNDTLDIPSSENATVQCELFVSILEQYCTDHYENNQIMFDRFNNSIGLKMAATILREELITRIQQLYRTLQQQIIYENMVNFDYMLRSKSQSNDLMSMYGMGQKENPVQKAQDLQMLVLQDVAILLRQCELKLEEALAFNYVGLLSPALKDKSAVKTEWGSTFTILQLKRHLEDMGKEYVNEKMIVGDYFPGVTKPPLNVQVNWLLDPRAWRGWVRNKNYDEHRDGFVDNRAEPIYMPGMRRLPYDPNKHPVSTEKSKSWLQSVKEYFASE